MAGPRARWLWLSLAGLVVAAAAGIAFVSLGDDDDGPPGPQATPPEGTVGLESGVRYELISGSCGYGVVVTPTGSVAPQEGEFCLISVDVRNRNDDVSMSFDASCQFLIDTSGARYRQRLDVLSLEEETAAFFREELPPNTVAREIGHYYDVAAGTEAVAIELHTSCDSPGVRIPLDPQGTTPVEE